jgi:hypothetical protein
MVDVLGKELVKRFGRVSAALAMAIGGPCAAMAMANSPAKPPRAIVRLADEVDKMKHLKRFDNVATVRPPVPGQEVSVTFNSTAESHNRPVPADVNEFQISVLGLAKGLPRSDATPLYSIDGGRYGKNRGWTYFETHYGQNGLVNDFGYRNDREARLIVSNALSAVEYIYQGLGTDINGLGRIDLVSPFASGTASITSIHRVR